MMATEWPKHITIQQPWHKKGSTVQTN